jgi:hypothetical protein
MIFPIDIGLSLGIVFFIKKISEAMTTNTTDIETNIVMTPAQMQEHWQGHRRLTRKMIERFPEDKLFSFSVGGMRPFAELVLEMIHMAGPGAVGIATGKWKSFEEAAPTTPKNKAELLAQWDNVTKLIDEYLPQTPEGRFQQIDKAFGQWEGPVFWSMMYFIDNEIHHRAQAYVYLRALGIEPPPFWER